MVSGRTSGEIRIFWSVVGVSLVSEIGNLGCELDVSRTLFPGHRVQNQFLRGANGGQISKFLLDLELSQLVLEPVKRLDHVLPKAEGVHHGERRDLH